MIRRDPGCFIVFREISKCQIKLNAWQLQLYQTETSSMSSRVIRRSAYVIYTIPWLRTSYLLCTCDWKQPWGSGC